jgi:hypothetical protein
MAALDILRNDFHGEWNYSTSPRHQNRSRNLSAMTRMLGEEALTITPTSILQGYEIQKHTAFLTGASDRHSPGHAGRESPRRPDQGIKNGKAYDKIRFHEDLRNQNVQ